MKSKKRSSALASLATSRNYGSKQQIRKSRYCDTKYFFPLNTGSNDYIDFLKSVDLQKKKEKKEEKSNIILEYFLLLFWLLKLCLWNVLGQSLHCSIISRGKE